jgi:hypothetical protein
MLKEKNKKINKKIGGSFVGEQSRQNPLHSSY